VYSWFYDSDHNSECKENDEAIFYDLGVPTTTSKRTVGTIATDGSVTVPVFTYKVHDPKHLPHECSLMPFFITLSKAEASDSQAVREAIMKGYQRFVKDSVKANLFVSSTSSHAAVPPPVDEEDEVTDIHVDEPSTDSQDTEAPASIQSQPGLSPKVLQRKAGSSTSLSSLNSTRSLKTTKMVPRGDLFKVNVADASAGSEKSGLGGMFKSKDNTVQPLFKGSMSDAVRVFSPLENRLKIKKGMFNRLTSGLGNIMGSSSSTSASASNADSEAENDSAPTTPNAPQPVIRPGEAIFVEWTVKKYNEYFDTNPDLELVEDPAISLENEKKKKNQSIGIEDCLDEFSKEETLGQDDLWYCPVVSPTRDLSKAMAESLVQETSSRNQETRNLQGS
jgi:ubiquitin carboxyl-terminal hydrolase 4/11/15